MTPNRVLAKGNTAEPFLTDGLPVPAGVPNVSGALAVNDRKQIHNRG